MSELAGARVVVTGGAGFLGRHLVRVLAARGATVIVPRRAEVDLRDVAATIRWVGDVAPSHLVHAAATGGGIGFMQAHPARAATDNVLMSTAAIEAARAAGVRRYVGVSSACAYPGGAVQPMREDAIGDGEPEPTNGPYGHAKRFMLVQGAAVAAEYGLDCAFAVPTNLYGPGDDFDPARSHVVPALIRRFEEARRAGAAEVVGWGTGQATRDLLHVADAAEGIVRLLEVGGGPAPVNLGSGVEHRVADIAAAVARAVGFTGALRWDPSRPDGMLRKVLDVSRARDRLGWQARIPLDVGLAETVAWFRSSS